MHKLYAVLLGGKAHRCNIELHDVVFVVGSNIEETYPLLVNKWFGVTTGLHIDSFVELQYVDGHEIRISKDTLRIKDGKSLYFINMGGYKEGVFGEIHEMDFFIGSSKKEVLSEAKKKLGKNLLELHCDNNVDVIQLLDDDIIEIPEIDGFNIHLNKINSHTPKNNIVSNYIKLDVPDIIKQSREIS